MKEKKFFLNLITTFTTPWLRENFFCFFNSVATFTTPWSTEKCFCISALNSLRHRQKKKKEIFIAPLPWLFCNQKKYPFLTSLRHSLCSYLLTSHYVTNKKVSKRCPPQKNTCNLKTFFLRNFSGVLDDLLPCKYSNFQLLDSSS